MLTYINRSAHCAQTFYFSEKSICVINNSSTLLPPLLSPSLLSFLSYWNHFPHIFTHPLQKITIHLCWAKPQKCTLRFIDVKRIWVFLCNCFPWHRMGRGQHPNLKIDMRNDDDGKQLECSQYLQEMEIPIGFEGYGVTRKAPWFRSRIHLHLSVNDAPTARKIL